ncbi:PadR family transcriptional regulator [Clostridium gasigenes]|uniref:Helix-turn-helix transcriptional regulator n=1 Tax=Clostridium gasigenes TaxID=94869 RepID=A0A1H0VFE4_9CLOT|nr:helix-turn-helix transcriptional regulator [Clostridium gasigenes]MBB6714769.1 helix-turn-helix transcriptional regulator [Clostridium gasigenes]SDP77272.1 Transcriptional regulator PadR-like family protein [Clostridium gasigenes]
MAIAITESTYYIMLAVLRPNHGYGIIQKVDELTKGRVKLGPGTLYGAINTLVSKRWIKLYSEETDSRKKKEYLITDLGRQILSNEIRRLKELVKNGEKESGEDD